MFQELSGILSPAALHFDESVFLISKNHHMILFSFKFLRHFLLHSLQIQQIQYCIIALPPVSTDSPFFQILFPSPVHRPGTVRKLGSFQKFTLVIGRFLIVLIEQTFLCLEKPGRPAGINLPAFPILYPSFSPPIYFSFFFFTFRSGSSSNISRTISCSNSRFSRIVTGSMSFAPL